MPPKAKYTREEIIDIALELAAEKGIEALTARELAGALDTSNEKLAKMMFYTIDFLIGFMTLSCKYNYIIFFRNVHSISDGCAAIFHNNIFPVFLFYPFQDIFDNGHGLFGAGIVGSDDGKIRKLHADLAHNGADEQLLWRHCSVLFRNCC